MMFPNKNNQVRSLRYGIGNQDLPKTNLVNALRYGTQLGSDFLTGSSISEALGYRPDVIKGQGYTPSYRDQFNTTVDLLRQGKTTEGLVKGAETLLTGTGAVGEGLAVKFIAHRDIAGKLPNPTDILTGKVKKLDTKEVSAMYSLITSLCYELKDECEKSQKSKKMAAWHKMADNFLPCTI